MKQSLLGLRQAGVWQTGSVAFPISTAQARPGRRCGSYFRYPLGWTFRSTRVGAEGASHSVRSLRHPFLVLFPCRGTEMYPSSLPRFTLLELHAEGSLLAFPFAQYCIEFPQNPWWWQWARPPSLLPSIFWELRHLCLLVLSCSAPPSPQASFFQLLWFRGGALAPWGLPQMSFTTKHFRCLWITGECLGWET